ncbi:MAG: DUF362 domain-containing protein [Lachnospiraceae bacterium]|nr:DUF362 domain-containing protein [Lachnospiraceae bacterium]
MTAKVSLLPTKSYDWPLVRDAVAEHFSLLEVSIAPDRPVVLKPNLILRCGPERAATFHPMVLEAVLAQLRDMGVKNIAVAESPGGPFTPGLLKALFDKTGVAKAAAKYHVPCITETQGIQRHRTENLLCRTFDIIAPVTEDVFLIDLCKVKTHCMMTFSGGVKNLFGCVPGLLKPQLHYRWPQLSDFSRMLLELAQTVAPQLTVIDAIDAMEGNGPTGGTSHPLHLLLAARDLYTQDYFAAGLMKLDPMKIEMIRQAAELGLARPDEIELTGDPVPAGLTPFKLPDTKGLDFSGNVPAFLKKPFLFFAGRLLKSYPQVDREKCVGCGKCAESCPAHVIRIAPGRHPGTSGAGKKAVFHKKGCISCFCCQEMCPVKAISVKKAL